MAEAGDDNIFDHPLFSDGLPQNFQTNSAFLAYIFLSDWLFGLHLVNFGGFVLKVGIYRR